MNFNCMKDSKWFSGCWVSAQQKFPRYQSTSVIPTSSDTWRDVEAFFRIAEPQRRAAKHLGHTWKIGKRFFANPEASSSAPHPQELNPWSSRTEEPLLSSTVEKSERRTQDQDQRRQSGQSAKKSAIFSGGDSSKNYGADQQRLQISDLQFDTFPSPATFACWKIRFKTEVCTCSQFPTEALQWIKEVELVDSVDDLMIFVIYSWYFKCRILKYSMRGLLQPWTRSVHNSHFKRRISLEEQKGPQAGSFPSR